MRSLRSKLNLMSVSAKNAEEQFNQGRITDTSFAVSTSDLFNVTPRRETNANEGTGKEEPDQVYYLGQTAKAGMSFDKAMSHHFGFLGAFALGQCVSTLIGSRAVKHVLTPLLNDLDIQRSNPTFSSVQKYAGIAKRWISSCAVDSMTVTFEKDSFAKVKADILASGQIKDSLETVTVVDAPDTTTLTLPLFQVAGETAKERLAAIHLIQCELAPGVWYDVTATAVSEGLNAEISLIPPIQDAGGGQYNIYVDGVYVPGVYESATEKQFKILFAPKSDNRLDEIQSEQDTATISVLADIAGDTPTEKLNNVLAIQAYADGIWNEITATAVTGKDITITPYSGDSINCLFKVYYVQAENWQNEPDRVVESALRVSELKLTVGGYWSDDDQKIYGGRVMRCELNSIEWQFKNSLKFEFCAGTGGAYANRCWRDGREQTLSIDRELRDFIYQKGLEKEEYFALSMVATGMEIEDGIDYQVEVLFPAVAIIDGQISESDNRDTEKIELQVLQKDDAPSVCMTVVNCFDQYCQ